MRFFENFPHSGDIYMRVKTNKIGISLVLKYNVNIVELKKIFSFFQVKYDD